MAQAYCVKDKMKVEVQNPKQITMKNGKPALSGHLSRSAAPRCSRSAAELFSSSTLDPRRATGGGLGLSGAESARLLE